MKRGKKYIDAAKTIDRAAQYDTEEAISLVKKVAVAKFDEEYPYFSPISVMLFSFSTFRHHALLSRRILLIN